jgi:CheY-specific phosphatase CheX
MPLARQIASIMFSMEPEAASMEEIRDALGEMVSITGGNLKAILAGDCHLSLPTVAEGLDYRLAVPRSRVVARVGFECQSHPLLVTLLERDATGREVPGHNLR